MRGARFGLRLRVRGLIRGLIRGLCRGLMGGALVGVAWAAEAQNRMVDTDGAIDLAGAVVLPSKWAVLLLVLGMVLVSLLGAVVALRAQERRDAEETRRRLEERLARQDAEIERLRARLGDPDPIVPAQDKSSDVNT